MVLLQLRLKIQKVFLISVVTLGATFILFPLIWMFLTSFKTAPEVLRVPLAFFPDNFFNFENYKNVLEQQPFLRFILNSMLISGLSLVVSLILCSMAGYGFSKFTFWVKEILFFLILSFLIVPFQSVVVPLFNWVARLNLIDTFIGLSLPLLTSAFGVFFMRQAMDGVPKDYIEAARIDGCSEIGIFFRVVLPMVKPALSTLAIIKFMMSWNEFLWPLVSTNSTKMKVVTVGLYSYTNMYFTEYHLVTAAAVFSLIPTLLIFITFQKGIIRSVALSGIK